MGAPPQSPLRPSVGPALSGKESARPAGGRGCLDGEAIVPSGGGELRVEEEGRGAPRPTGEGLRPQGGGPEAGDEHVDLAPSPPGTEAGSRDFGIPAA